LRKLKIVNTMIDLCVFQTFSYGDFIQSVAKLIIPKITRVLITNPRTFTFMVALSAAFDLSKNLIKRLLSYGAFCFGGYDRAPVSIRINFFFYIAFFLKVFYKIINRVFCRGQFVLPIQFP